MSHVFNCLWQCHLQLCTDQTAQQILRRKHKTRTMAGVTERGLWFSEAKKVSEYSKDKSQRHPGGGLKRQVSDSKGTCASVVVPGGLREEETLGWRASKAGPWALKQPGCSGWNTAQEAWQWGQPPPPPPPREPWEPRGRVATWKELDRTSLQSFSHRKLATRCPQDGKFGSIWAKRFANFRYQPLTSCCLMLMKAVNITQG